MQEITGLMLRHYAHRKNEIIGMQNKLKNSIGLVVKKC